MTLEKDQVAVAKPINPSTGISSNSTRHSFKLQPAPKQRKHKKPDSEQRDQQCHQGRFQERFSWWQAPTSAILEQGSTIPATIVASPTDLLACNESPVDPETTSQLHSAFDDSVDDVCTLHEHRQAEDDEDEEQVATPRATLLNSAKIKSETDVNIRLSQNAGSVASIRRNPVSNSSSSSSSSSPSSSSPVITPKSSDMTFVLATKSPTPSSPLFPRRTLIRSLSSSCIVTSPTSPLRTPPSLRKRLGWRGRAQEKLHDETMIPMSPCSPLTPNRARALHTPTQANLTLASFPSIDQLRIQGHEREPPLSATLKALGAKRHSEAYDLFSPTSSPAHAKRSSSNINTDTINTTFSSNAANDESFQVLTATRKLFHHLPTWVKFQSNHHRRSFLLQENRKVAQDFASLGLPRASTNVNLDSAAESLEDAQMEKSHSTALPRMLHAGTVAPDSPNGHLFSGLADFVKSEQVECPKDVPEEAVKVIRRPAIATLRSAGTPRGSSSLNHKMSSLVGALRGSSATGTHSSHFFGQRGGAEKGIDSGSDGSLSSSHQTHSLQRPEDRRDGWGGVLTRWSWFRNQSRGPLVSPLRSVRFADQDPPTKNEPHLRPFKTRNSFKSLYLVLGNGTKTATSLFTLPEEHEAPRRASASGDEWEDIEELQEEPEKQREKTSFLEMNPNPRFRTRSSSASANSGQTWGWFGWRKSGNAVSRSFVPSPKTHDDARPGSPSSFASIPLDLSKSSFESSMSWLHLPKGGESNQKGVAVASSSQMISTSDSIENRPINKARSWFRLSRVKLFFALLTIALVASVVANIVLAQHRRDQERVTIKHVVGVSTASIPPPSSATATQTSLSPSQSTPTPSATSSDSSNSDSTAAATPTASAEWSTIQKAAQLSQPTSSTAQRIGSWALF